MSTDKLKVGVLFGGKSGEHEVSLKSARSVMDALDPESMEIIPIGITKQGDWISGDSPWQTLWDNKTYPGNYSVTLLPFGSSRGLYKLEPFEQVTDLDVVFPVLHGTFGEDGTIQGLLELANIPYVGSGVLGSAMCMDKAIMKRILKNTGLKVANYYSFNRENWAQGSTEIISLLEKIISYPMFVKPANLGSSVGISKVRHREELTAGIHQALKYDMKCLVEDYVPGQEIELSILGNEKPQASICGEIIPANEFYDYDAKYLNKSSRLVIPAPLSEKTSEKVREWGVTAYKALECRGLARVDFFVTEDEEVFINELNTMPGFTEISMYPKLWLESGMTYTELLTKLIDLALEHHKEKAKTVTDYKN